MALDQQRNWNISMAENLEHVKRSAGRGGISHETIDKTKTAKQEQPVVWTTEPVYLPDEIIVHILEYISNFHESQYTLASCCLLSWQWYSAAVPFLYHCPHLEGKNFDPFVRVIRPSMNLSVRKSPQAALVKILDMRSLVHQGSKSTTARLLGRTKGSLEAFLAPVATFGSNCYPPLSKCHSLRLLDLSLVSESPQLLELLRAVSHLEHLTTFRLPRSAGFGGIDPINVVWPPKLEELNLSGGIDAHFLRGIVSFPLTLRSLTIEHCPMARGYAVMHMLRVAVKPLPKLESLKFAHLPRLTRGTLDRVLYRLPSLVKLSISVDYITPAIFDFDIGGHIEAVDFGTSLPEKYDSRRDSWVPEGPCKLRTLELTHCGDPRLEERISPIDILIAIDEGTLPALRQVRVSESLEWHSPDAAGDVEPLVDALQELAIKRGDSDDGAPIGVWTF